MERLIFGGPVDWASLIAGSKFTVFVLFYFVFEGNFPSTNHRGGGGGAYIWKGDLTGGFLRYRFQELIFGGAYFRNFTVFLIKDIIFLQNYTLNSALKTI